MGLPFDGQGILAFGDLRAQCLELDLGGSDSLPGGFRLGYRAIADGFRFMRFMTPLGPHRAYGRREHSVEAYCKEAKRQLEPIF
jgi:hypothetical protein